MIVNDLLHEYRPPTVVLTTSGAAIVPIGNEAARTFLERRWGIATVLDSPGVAWGAFADRTTLIGVAVLSSSSSSQGQACVAVVPECQRHRVGSDLAEVLVHEVKGRGLKTLACPCISADPVPQEFVRSLHLITARRVNGNTAVMVLLIPNSTRQSFRGEQ